MLQIEVVTQSGGILIDKIEYRIIRYLVFKKCIANIIRYFNI